MKTKLLENPRFVIPMLALAVAVVISGCWNGPFCAVDDPLTIHQMLSHTVPQLFTPKAGKHFMPVTDLSLRLDYFFAPQQMVSHMNDVIASKGKLSFDLNQSWAVQLRIMNALYHLVAAVFLWIFLRRLGAGAGISFFVAMVWAGHPMACESVCWIAERKNVLAALFGFAALSAWTLDPAWRWRLPLVHLLFLLALMSKPAALSFLPLLLALEVVDPIQRQFNVRDSAHWLRMLKHTFLLIVMGVVFTQIGRHVYSLEIVDTLGGSLWSIILTDVWILGLYVKHMLLPTGLCFLYYIEPVTSLGDARLWIAGIPLAGLVAALIWFTQPAKRFLTVLALFWFVSGLGPNLNLVTTTAPLQDRWVYMSMSGFLLALGLAVHGIMSRSESTRRALPYVMGVALAAMLACTAVHSRVYATSETLIADTAARELRSGYAQLLAAQLCGNKHQKAMEDKDGKAAVYWGEKSLQYYARAIEAPDIEYFQDAMILRVRMAEMMVGMRAFDLARKVMENWLPPKGREMTPARNRLDYGHTYTSKSLAHAFELMAECSLQESNMPGVEPAKKMALCEQALRELDDGRKADRNDYKGDIVQARVLMQMSYLAAENGRDDDAKKNFVEATEVLKAVPENSKSSPMARMLLTNARPPKTKDNAGAAPTPGPPFAPVPAVKKE